MDICKEELGEGVFAALVTPLETEMLTALETVLRAYKGYGALARHDSEEYTSLTAVRRAIKHARAAKVAIDVKTDWSWECNECGASEYTSVISESDLEDFGIRCGVCGSEEFHKVVVKA